MIEIEMYNILQYYYHSGSNRKFLSILEVCELYLIQDISCYPKKKQGITSKKKIDEHLIHSHLIHKCYNLENIKSLILLKDIINLISNILSSLYYIG